MGRRGRSLGKKRNKKRRIRKRNYCSDGSDEDYVLGEDESDDFLDSCDSSSFGDFSEGNFNSRETSSNNSSDEERKVVRLNPRKRISGRNGSGVKRSRRRTKVLDDDDDDDDDGDDDDDDEEFKPDVEDGVDDEDEFLPVRKNRFRSVVPKKKGSVKSEKGKQKPNGLKRAASKRRRRLVSKKSLSSDNGLVVEDKIEREKKKKENRKKKKSIVDSELYFVDSESSDDEEFMTDVDDGVDDDDEFRTVRRSRFRSVVPKKKGSVKSQKRKQKSKGFKKTASKRRGRLILRSVSSDDDFVVDKREKKTNVKRRKKRSIMNSKSNFVDSESSDFDCTIPEEERDPLRELRRRGNLTTCSRSSSLSKRLQVEGGWKVRQERTLERKGKEKVNDLNIDTEKQLCGICLSEERKGIVRGTLNCCAHYFCFTCIMEWSKVESRCPQCKQRFTTISKPARLDAAVSLRNSVIRIPKRDQVYQPSEEEVRQYLDPYQNIICMKCERGEDDDLMLLCDICDSPAHTYCVGLGGEVPEGNWYCEDCASSDFGTSNSQVHDPVLGQGTSNSGLCSENPTGGIDAEDLDTIFPEQSFPYSNYLPASPRYPLGEDHRTASPIPGAGASTISGRRRLRFQIQMLLSNNRMSQIPEMSDRIDGLPHPILESPVVPEVELGGENTGHARSLENGGSYSAAVEARKQGLNKTSALLESSSVQNRVPFYSRLSNSRRSNSRRQRIQGPSTPSISSSPIELEQINPSDTVLGYEQHNLCCRRVTGSNANVSQCNYSEGSSFPTEEDAKELENDGSHSSAVEARKQSLDKLSAILENGGSHSAAVEVRKQGLNKTSALLESSSLVQNRIAFCSRLSNSRRQRIQGPSTPSISSSPAELEQINPSDTVLGYEQHNLCSRHVTGSNANIVQCNYSEGSSFHTAADAKEQVQSLVKRHLKLLCRVTVLEKCIFKMIARKSTHTILAVCRIEHSKRMATPVQPPSKCSHIEKEGGPFLLKGCCSSCFDSFVKDVVLRLMNATLQPQ